MKPRALINVLLALVAFIWTSRPARAAIAISDLWPTNDLACVDTPLRLTFTDPPTLGNHGLIVVCRASDGTMVDTIDLGAAAFTNEFGGSPIQYEPVLIEGRVASIRLHSKALAEGQSYFVRVEPGVFKDSSGTDFEGISGSARWQFKTKAARVAERLTVAADGSGDFCTVQGAVDQVPSQANHPTTIFVHNGVYDGIVRVGPGKNRITLVGEDRHRTILTGRNNERLNIGTRARTLIGVEGDDFLLENLTVINRTPYKGTQAEAVRVHANRCILRHADFKSFQDTLMLEGRVYVANCYIEGDVDFVWGSGATCFEQCEIRAMHNGYYVQARNPVNQAGYIFINCRLTSPAEVTKCWLARIESERFPASQVAYLHCQMGSHIPAAGWLITGTKNDALRFQEFESTDLDGKPLDVSQRHPASKQLSPAEATALSDVRAVLGGVDGWNPKSN